MAPGARACPAPPSGPISGDWIRALSSIPVVHVSSEDAPHAKFDAAAPQHHPERIILSAKSPQPHRAVPIDRIRQIQWEPPSPRRRALHPAASRTKSLVRSSLPPSPSLPEPPWFAMSLVATSASLHRASEGSTRVDRAASMPGPPRRLHLHRPSSGKAVPGLWGLSTSRAEAHVLITSHL
ncbi:uncharacterized protein LOC125523731 [Triticum urartu]|uniref:uncharacterized protein LOC125523731 n=1 Tax=Triticum urartu TaxID=4572 RepID=UPI0020449810|nr:uncharacterized protein LOC125523731 [Triticum urartu]